MDDLPDFTGELVEPDFDAAESEGQFIYGYVRNRNSEKFSFKARTLYYVGKASRAVRVTERHNGVPVPKNRKFIQIIKRGLTEEEANYWECYYISKLGRIDKGTGILRNRTDGGEGVTGRLISEDQKHRRNEALAVTAGARYGLSAEEWKEVQKSGLTSIRRAADVAKRNGYKFSDWLKLSEEQKQSIGQRNGEIAENAAKKWGYTTKEWFELPDTERNNMSTRSATAEENGFTLKEWLQLTNSEKQSIGRLQATAKKYELNVKEYSALTKSAREVMKLQIKQAKKHGYTLENWRALTHEEQCSAAAINRARKAAANFDVPVEVWIGLAYNQRAKIRDRFKRGRRVPELLEDL